MIVKALGVPERIGGIRRYAQALSLALQENLIALEVFGLSSLSNPDIFHAVRPLFWLPRSSRVAVSFHDLAPLTGCNSDTARRNPFYSYLFRLQAKSSINRAVLVAVDSNELAEEIKAYFPFAEGRVRVVHPAILPKFRKIRESQHDGQQFVGYPRGTERRIKGLTRLLPDVKFLPLRGVPEEHIVDYYNSLDYFVDLSLYRGFGYPLAEARACGVTVFTLRNARIPREVTEITIQVDDEQDVASKIASGFTQPYRASPFTIRRMASEARAVYFEVLE